MCISSPGGPHTHNEAPKRNREIPPLILKFSSIWRWSVSWPGHSSQAKLPLIPIEQEIGCDPEPVWTLLRENPLTPARNRTAISQLSSPQLGLYTDWATPAKSTTQYQTKYSTEWDLIFDLHRFWKLQCNPFTKKSELQVVTLVLTKSHIFFSVMLCWLVNSYRCVREA